MCIALIPISLSLYIRKYHSGFSAVCTTTWVYDLLGFQNKLFKLYKVLYFVEELVIVRIMPVHIWDCLNIFANCAVFSSIFSSDVVVKLIYPFWFCKLDNDDC